MIAAVIPTRYHPPQLASLLKVLIADGVQYHVMESWAFEHRIYAMWNAGVEDARRSGAEYVAILNDDITILPGTLRVLGEWLADRPDVGVVYPDHRLPTNAGFSPVRSIVPTTGTWGAGGMTGFCFMFRADLGISFDEGYHWWYGDDAFEEAVRARGLLVARIDGLPIDHVPNGSASKAWDELAPLIIEDRRRWDTRQRVIVQHEQATVTR